MNPATVRACSPNFLNAAPFVHGLDARGIEVVSLSPSAMYERFEAGDTDIAFMPLASVVRLGDKVRDLNKLGIAATSKAQSVALFSDGAVEDLHGATIALTAESATSVELVKILLKEHWRVDGVRYTDRDPRARAELLIGDRALRRIFEGEARYIYDLGSAWIEMTGLPFVFAQWVARTDLAPSVHREIGEAIANNLRANLKAVASLAERYATDFITADRLVCYFETFGYELGDREFGGMKLFTDKLNREGHYKNRS